MRQNKNIMTRRLSTSVCRLFITVTILSLFSNTLLCAQNQKQDYFEFLQEIFFENSNHQYDSVLLEKLHSLQQQAIENTEYEQVLWMLANVELNSDLDAAAFVHFFRLISLFPDSHFYMASTHILDSLRLRLALPASYAKYPAELPSQQNIEEALFNEIAFLYSQPSDTLMIPLKKEIQDFIQHYQDSKFSDILLFWDGIISERIGLYYQAEILYRSVLRLYPQTPVLGQVKLNLGLLYLNHLNSVFKARDYLLKIVNNYAGKPIAGDAQFALDRYSMIG